MPLPRPHDAFADRIAVITGAASGIGRETVTQLLASGATVIASDKDAEGLKHLQADFIGNHEQKSLAALETHIVDVTDVEGLRAFVDHAAEQHGRIDYMFSNAGIAGKTGEARDLNAEDWEHIVNVNLMSVIHGASFAYAHMRKQGHGHLVNMASAAGLLGLPTAIPYATTKAAVIAFSRDLRSEAATFGVDVTVLCPGFIESRIFENAGMGTVDIQKSKNAIPVKFVPVDLAVRKMLKGVASRSWIVVFPGYVRVLWFLRRLAPGLYDRLLGAVGIRGGRKNRFEE